MFGHKARQFAEFERRQAVEPYFEYTKEGPYRHASKQDYYWTARARRIVAQWQKDKEFNAKSLVRFRGYAYKGVAGKV